MPTGTLDLFFYLGADSSEPVFFTLMAIGIGARKEVRRAEVSLGRVTGGGNGVASAPGGNTSRGRRVDRLDATVINEPMGKPRSPRLLSSSRTVMRHGLITAPKEIRPPKRHY
jgi:hypothetical protein